jgi:hypothetical protein
MFGNPRSYQLGNEVANHQWDHDGDECNYRCDGAHGRGEFGVTLYIRLLLQN